MISENELDQLKKTLDLQGGAQNEIFARLGRLIGELGKNAASLAISPGQTPDDRSYNCGFAAGLDQLNQILDDLVKPQ